jgi:hypothetical protein
MVTHCVPPCGYSHGLQSGDKVVFSEVNGMVEVPRARSVLWLTSALSVTPTRICFLLMSSPQLNGHEAKVVVKSPTTVSIGDISAFTAHTGGGIMRQVKESVTVCAARRRRYLCSSRIGGEQGAYLLTISPTPHSLPDCAQQLQQHALVAAVHDG